MKKVFYLLLTVMFILIVSFNQTNGQTTDSVDVTFRWNISGHSGYSVPGEFNDWNNAASPMVYQGDNLWTRVERLPVGGNPNPPAAGIPGAWQYKFYYSGAGQWPNDPLNHHVNPDDNNNTYIYLNDPTIYHLLPNSRSDVLHTSTPAISAYLYPKVGSTILTDSIELKIDDKEYSDIGSYYNHSTQKLLYTPPDHLNNGEHKLVLSVKNAQGETNIDSTSFTVQAGLQVVVLRPNINESFGDPRRAPVFALEDDSIDIQITWTQADTKIELLQLLKGAGQIASTTSDTLDYVFYTAGNDPGFIGFTAIVTDTSGLSDSANFEILINPPVNEAALPAGLQAGINYINNQTVSLVLFAPYKEFVYVLGDFNDWKVDLIYQMNRHTVDDDSVYWWLTIDGLTPGEEYAFQYYVDGEIRIADPYTEKVLDPWNDKYIDESTYPNLKPYPYNKTDQIVSVFQTDQQPYNWQVNDFNRPQQSELIIYELLIRDFVDAHDYKTLIDTLDYLENLGVNAIELMPVNEFEGNLSWGYNPSLYFAPDKYYGPANDLKAFVDACHARGIAVIIDMVLNHSYGQSPFVQLYLDYYGTNEIIMKLPNPWFNRNSPNTSYRWGADFNHESPATKALVDRINRYWLSEFKMDGFRFDFTKGFTNKPGDGGGYDASRIAILKRMADQIWAYDPQAYVILEHFADNSEEINLSDYGMMIWGNHNYNYNEATMGYHDNGKSDFSGGYFKTRSWNEPHLVTYMESHDEERLMFKNMEYGNSSGDYNIQHLVTSLQRVKMAAAFFFTYPGPKMIWQFGELGYDYSIDYNGRVGEKPIRWDYLENIDRDRLYRTFSTLIKLRREHLVFNAKNTSVTMAVQEKVKRINLLHGVMNVAIIGNFDVVTKTGQPKFNVDNWWYDYFSGDSLYVNDLDTTITLAAGEFHIFTDRKLPTPDEDLLTDIMPERAVVIADYKLKQNYPNPFNPSTRIDFSLPKSQKVELTIYNILGQKIKTLLNSYLSAGNHIVEFKADLLPSGIYFYRLKTGQGTIQKKMVLLR